VSPRGHALKSTTEKYRKPRCLGQRRRTCALSWPRASWRVAWPRRAFTCSKVSGCRAREPDAASSSASKRRSVVPRWFPRTDAMTEVPALQPFTPREHLQPWRWLECRIWEETPPVAASANRPEQVHIREGTPEWRAWQRHLVATTGRGTPVNNRGGWYFPSKLPLLEAETPPKAHAHSSPRAPRVPEPGFKGCRTVRPMTSARRGGRSPHRACVYGINSYYHTRMRVDVYEHMN
jgi:hypothetical protein